MDNSNDPKTSAEKTTEVKEEENETQEAEVQEVDTRIRVLSCKNVTNASTRGTLSTKSGFLQRQPECGVNGFLRYEAHLSGRLKSDSVSSNEVRRKDQRAGSTYHWDDEQIDRYIESNNFVLKVKKTMKGHDETPAKIATQVLVDLLGYDNVLRIFKDSQTQMGIHKPTATFQIKNMSYAVRKKKHNRSEASYTTENNSSTIEEEKQRDKILNDISLLLLPGRFTLLLGPPGAGKSVLLKLLAGKLNATRKFQLDGEITLNGHNIQEPAIQKVLPAMIGFASQEDHFEPFLTVRETLKYAHRSTRMCSKTSRKYENSLASHPKISNFGLFRIEDYKGNVIKCHHLDHLYSQKGRRILSSKDGEETHSDDEVTETNLVLDDLLIEFFLKIFGLVRCANTIVGNEVIRGISGGERKRLTSAEMVVGEKASLLLDDISTGLDSSTTLEIMNFIGALSKTNELVTVISLLQPPPEVFETFDDVIVLSEGRLIYHGPIALVLSFFNSVGYLCPDRIDVADFIQSVTKADNGQSAEDYRENGNQFYYKRLLPMNTQISDEQMKSLIRTEHPLYHSDQFAEAYKGWKTRKKHVRRKTKRSMSHEMMFMDSEEDLEYQPQHDGVHPAQMFAPFACNPVEELGNVLRHSMLLKRATIIQDIIRLSSTVIVALISGTIFFGIETTNPDGAQIVLGLLFSGIMFLATKNFFHAHISHAKVPLFLKYRNANFYHTITFVISHMITETCFVLVDTIIYSVLVFWLAGLGTSAAQFFTYLLVAFLYALQFVAVARTLGALANTPPAAMALTALLLNFFIYASGYVLVENLIPWWFRWIFWSSPASYALRSLALNTFLPAMDPRMSQPVTTFCRNGPQYTEVGQCALAQYSMAGYGFEWIWYGVIFLAGYLFVWVLLYALTLSFTVRKKKNIVKVEPKPIPRNNEDRKQEHRLTHIQELRNESMDLTFKNINYFVSMGKNNEFQLLTNISGYCEHGTMTALMGVSGAGKTTLLDLLSGRKNKGRIEGEIKINGDYVALKTFAANVGYVEQFDILCEFRTVAEEIFFTTALKLHQCAKPTRKAHAEYLIDLLELEEIRDTVIGIEGAGGIRLEERKRLSIALQMASNPDIIFLDEPTSGLDSRGAKMVIDVIRKIADEGRTIITTIHQPSTAVFQTFDNLVLMGAGGNLMYMGKIGENSCDLINYFEKLSDDIPTCPPNFNPSTWALTLVGQRKQELLTSWQNSKHREESLQKIKNLVESNLKPLTGLNQSRIQYAPTSFQLSELLKRTYIIYSRVPGYSITRNVGLLFFSLILGGLFYQLQWNSISAIVSGVAVLLIQATQNALLNYAPTISFNSEARPLFYKEVLSGLYRKRVYSLTQTLVEIPLLILQTLLCSWVFYFLVGFPANGNPRFDATSFFLFWFINFELCFVFINFAQLLSAACETPAVAQLIGGLILPIMIQVSGLLIPVSKISVFWQWLYWISPFHYALEGLVTTQFYCEGCRPTIDNIAQLTIVNNPCPASCPQVSFQGPGGIDISGYLSDVLMFQFDYNADNLAFDMWMLFLLAAVLYITKTFLHVYVNFTKR
eukprot:g1729.t1